MAISTLRLHISVDSSAHPSKYVIEGKTQGWIEVT